jgi:SAM-dependent methyltransferase
MGAGEFSLRLQQQFWNRWNADKRENGVGKVSLEQTDVVLSWLKQIGKRDLDIIDVGCGAGWLCPHLTEFGRVTGTDLSDEVVGRAAARFPDVNYVAGDFMALEFGQGNFDVVVSLEVLSHVADQPAFIEKISSLLRPGGYFIIGTPNKPALMRNNIPPPEPGQLRHWTDRHELGELLGTRFEVLEMRSITPVFNRGLLRIPNSYKLNHLASALKLSPVTNLVKKAQERAWLGWTLMALATKRAT